MLIPQIGCNTFGSWDFIRVPAPAARMTTAAGRLTVTWRAPWLAAWLAAPGRGHGHDRSRGAGERSSLARPSQDTVSRRAEAGIGGSATGVTVRDHARWLGQGRSERFRSNSTNKLGFLSDQQRPLPWGYLVLPVLSRSSPISVYLKRLPARVEPQIGRHDRGVRALQRSHSAPVACP